MKKLIKTLLLVLTLFINMNAWADVAIFSNPGKWVWRDSREVEGQGIAWEFLNNKIIYAKMLNHYGIRESGREAICSSTLNNEYGKRLFDIADKSFCNNSSNLDNYNIYIFVFDSDGSTWNYHALIGPASNLDQWDGQIVEIQMGSTITRTPPKILRVMEKSDTCKDDGPILPRSNKKIICNGWASSSLRQYWGKDVPPELKALNGTGVIKSVEDVSTTHATGVISAEPSSPVVITNPQ